LVKFYYSRYVLSSAYKYFPPVPVFEGTPIFQCERPRVAHILNNTT